LDAVPSGFFTVRPNLPDVTAAVVGTDAVREEALTKLVIKEAPIHVATDPWTKPLPESESVNADVPASTWLGLTDVIVGGAAAVTVKDRGMVDMPPGLVTVTDAVPGVAIRLAGTIAVNRVASAKEVWSETPFHRTVEAGMKPEPFTVKLKAGPPAGADMGLIEPIAAVGAMIVRFRLNDEAPEPSATRTST
jgi:hypothetical protein